MEPLIECIPAAQCPLLPPLSTNIPDERRTVNSISVSPIGDLSACVDGFGRVLLLDNHAMTIRKMWKGMRLIFSNFSKFCVLYP